MTAANITRFTYTRLFNTGNYEHEKIEVAVDMPVDGPDTGSIMLDVIGAVADLKPEPIEYGVFEQWRKRLVELRARPVEEQQQSYVHSEITGLEGRIGDYLRRRERYAAALNRLNNLGVRPAITNR